MSSVSPVAQCEDCGGLKLLVLGSLSGLGLGVPWFPPGTSSLSTHGNRALEGAPPRYPAVGPRCRRQHCSQLWSTLGRTFSRVLATGSHL